MTFGQWMICYQIAKLAHQLHIVCVVFFTLVHAYLFLYPCFRAAAIATARAKMISAISKRRWLNIPLSSQNNFVQYLISQKFAFRVPLFCASIPIGFNWVFVSFFVPVLGAYLSFQIIILHYFSPLNSTYCMYREGYYLKLCILFCLVVDEFVLGYE